MGNILKEITNKTLKTIKKFDIVLPADYSKIFKEKAVETGLDLKDEKIILEHLNQDIDKMNNIFDQTKDSLASLHVSTKSARNAIERQDINELERIKSDIMILQEKVHFLQNELFTDSLTNAYNRKWFNDHFLSNEKFKNNGIIGFLDLNNFKSINDSYGHIVGDMVLKYLVAFLKANIITSCFYLVRYAGDEFIIIFEEYRDVDAINSLIEDLQQKLSLKTLTPKHDKSITFSFTFSYGLSKYKTGDDFSDIINIIDDKMYQNKEFFKKGGIK